MTALLIDGPELLRSALYHHFGRDPPRKSAPVQPITASTGPPISGVLPDLFRIAGGDGKHILTISNHGPVSDDLGMRNSFEGELRYNVLGDFAKLAAEGRFRVPVARIFTLEAVIQ